MPAPCVPYRFPLLLLLGLVGSAVGCEGCEPAAVADDAGAAVDDEDAGGWGDAGANDNDDAGANDDDAGANDSDDAGGNDSDDAGANDDDAGGSHNDDAGANDADAGANESDDAGANEDAGPTPSPCVSGASGSHALRFRWNGTTSGSTAWVSYETNTLPDTSRWKAGAYQGIGYSPVFVDPYLGEGGLELSGSVFIDVELSTAGLSTMNNATLAIYGRSFNTTASGSFTWQTGSGTGATPSGFVANSAPYEWYAADVASAVPAGDDGVLLRIRPGPPSNALVVNRVEICFDAS